MCLDSVPQSQARLLCLYVPLLCWYQCALCRLRHMRSLLSVPHALCVLCATCALCRLCHMHSVSSVPHALCVVCATCALCPLCHMRSVSSVPHGLALTTLTPFAAGPPHCGASACIRVLVLMLVLAHTMLVLYSCLACPLCHVHAHAHAYVPLPAGSAHATRACMPSPLRVRAPLLTGLARPGAHHLAAASAAGGHLTASAL